MAEESSTPNTGSPDGGPPEAASPEKAASREFGSWKVEGYALEINYSLEVMDEICHAAWEGLQKIPRRGLEIGGLLFGMRHGDRLEINAWRPIACEHAKGPGFELSSKDEGELKQQLESAAEDPGLKLLEALGWFHSHTRDEVRLSKTDLDLHNRFFPAPYQVALVLRPHASEHTRAGFFSREADGSIHWEASHKEFVPETRRRRAAIGFDAAHRPAGAGRAAFPCTWPVCRKD
jgi:proteasome lid subunit RPN8/RPN11